MTAVTSHGLPGVFITFEGGDGTGKSTQAALLQEALQLRGFPVQRTFEPGGTSLGRRIRELLLHGEDVSERAEALLYAADRAHNVATMVRPTLAQAKIVVQDRYLDSSVAYQGAGRHLSTEEVRALSLWAAEGLVPDLTILLDAPITVSAQRIAYEKGQPDRLEGAGREFHEQVRREYLELARQEPQRWVVVDATRSLAEVAVDVLAAAEPRVKHLLPE